MRMQNIRLTLLNDDITFEVVVDNEIVAKDFTSMIPNVQNYLLQSFEEQEGEDDGPCQCTCRECTCLQQGREIPDDGKEKRGIVTVERRVRVRVILNLALLLSVISPRIFVATRYWVCLLRF